MHIYSFIKQVLHKIFRRKRNSKRLLADLSHFTPDYCKNMIEKYGNNNWALTGEQFQQEMNKAQLSYFDKIQSNGNETKSI